MRIAIFGGAFDPPHLGHLKVIKSVVRLNLVDQVWLMPNFSGSWKTSSAKPEDRLAMCQLLVEKLSKVLVSDFEIKKAGVSYTLQTVKELKKKYPKNSFFWLMGSDLMSEVTQWENCQGLTEELVFLIFPRTKISSTEIREKIQKQQSVSALVGEKIEEYLKNHGLYY